MAFIRKVFFTCSTQQAVLSSNSSNLFLKIPEYRVKQIMGKPNLNVELDSGKLQPVWVHD